MNPAAEHSTSPALAGPELAGPELAGVVRTLQSLLGSVSGDVDRATLAAAQILAVLQDVAVAQLRLLRAIEEHRYGTYAPPPADVHALS